MLSIRLKIAFLSSLLVVSPGLQAENIDFARDIQPIFAEHCTTCHGPDDQKGGLNLTKEKSLHGKLKSGEPGDSELLYRITTQDTDELMPPPEHGAPDGMPRAAAAAPSGGRAEAAPSVLPLQARGAGLRDAPKPPQGGAPLEPPPLEAAISAWARDVRALRDEFARRRADAADASARAPGASETAGSPVAEHARRRSAEQMGLTCALLDLLGFLTLVAEDEGARLCLASAGLAARLLPHLKSSARADARGAASALCRALARHAAAAAAANAAVAAAAAVAVKAAPKTTATPVSSSSASQKA